MSASYNGKCVPPLKQKFNIEERDFHSLESKN